MSASDIRHAFAGTECSFLRDQQGQWHIEDVASPAFASKFQDLARLPAHYLWAVLIVRIYEVFPLLCPICGGQMRLIAFITNTAEVRKILDHIGVDSQPPPITPARGPSLWDNCDAPTDDVLEALPDWDQTAQPAPDDCADQRIHW